MDTNVKEPLSSKLAFYLFMSTIAIGLLSVVGFLFYSFFLD